jgi:hypothetical protein
MQPDEVDPTQHYRTLHQRQPIFCDMLMYYSAYFAKQRASITQTYCRLAEDACIRHRCCDGVGLPTGPMCGLQGGVSVQCRHHTCMAIV